MKKYLMILISEDTVKQRTMCSIDDIVKMIVPEITIQDRDNHCRFYGNDTIISITTLSYEITDKAKIDEYEPRTPESDHRSRPRC